MFWNKKLSLNVEEFELGQPFYTKEVYCCTCDLHHFSVKVPKGRSPVGCHATCPQCMNRGIINHYGQVWPIDRGIRY